MASAAPGATLWPMRRLPLSALLLSCVFLASCVGQTEARRPETIGAATVSSASAISSTAKSQSSRKARVSNGSAKSFTKPVAAPAPTPATPPTELTVPILVYHHIRPTSSYPKETWSYKMSVSPNTFETQMQWLVDHGYTTISLNTLAEMRAGTRLGPTNPIVVTFDDNQMSSYELGVPVLVKNNQTATFYLITNRLENKDSIGTAQIPDLIAKGMEIGSHTVSHAILTNLSDSALATELKDSRTALEAVTGTPVVHLAYPLTAQNERVRTAAGAAGYVTATVMDPRNSTMKDSNLKLPRIMMTDDTDLARILP